MDDNFLQVDNLRFRIENNNGCYSVYTTFINEEGEEVEKELTFWTKSINELYDYFWVDFLKEDVDEVIFDIGDSSSFFLGWV